jgi:hypothetical protein
MNAGSVHWRGSEPMRRVEDKKTRKRENQSIQGDLSDLVTTRV